MNATTTLREGDRIVLTGPVDRFPHFRAPAGATGTVTLSDGEYLCARMDARLPGAELWDNEIVWSLADGDDPALDLRPLDAEAAQ